MRTPDRFLLLVGIPIGLLFALLGPPWGAGADEATHFARSVDIAHGNLMPHDTAQGDGSEIPLAYRVDQGLVGANYLAEEPPVTWSLLGDLLESSPDWSVTFFVDTQPTTASTPVGYLPSAAAMVVPNAAGWPGVVVLWAGRIGDLAVYLGLSWLAVRTAAAFAWSLALAAVFPLNLALAASVTPDALTMGALFLVLALWTRVRARAVEPPGSGAPATVADLRRLAVVIGGACLLLALAKPPYFLAVAMFPALLLRHRRDRRVQVAAGAAGVAGLVGLVVTALNSSNNYQAVTETLIDRIEYQPDVQRERLLGDPLGFLWTCIETWFGELDDYVQVWTRQLGLWRVELPLVVPWILLLAVVVAALRLDRADLAALRGIDRAVPALAAASFIVVLYASSYIYFDDTEEGIRIGRQMGRYVLPLLPLALMGWLPRWEPVHERLDRLDRGLVVGAAASALGVAAVAAALTWLWLGAGQGTG